MACNLELTLVQKQFLGGSRMSKVFRYFVERKLPYQSANEALKESLERDLGIKSIAAVRLLERYDVESAHDFSDDLRFQAILAEPQTDDLFKETVDFKEAWVFAIEALPGQYDQRADSAAQCIEVVSQLRPKVRVAQVYAMVGSLSEKEKEAIKAYLINPVERREASLEKPASLEEAKNEIAKVATIEDFITMDENGLKEVLKGYGLAMDLDDILYMQAYFKDEAKRNPTEAELRVIDTYWSDHCRHTTFNTDLVEIEIDDERVQSSFNHYLALREEVYGEKALSRPKTLMDIATLSTKVLKKRGEVTGLDESEEINACSVKVEIETTAGKENWLYMFKNETHNHPTEIEPFGGAATCLGGAIRDPLSGRSYVYQGLRLTGAANPLVPVSETRAGKLSQRQICTLAAKGFSSYGNQIGLSTGLVDEVYHSGYEAKRMEVGAVIAAAPEKNVRRERPQKGDLVVLVGGRTGRDGCGGATGSSKTHTEDSLQTAGAEVQKGNPVEERKIQRLFRRSDLAPMIKRCNDFGAGGVSVSVGELADGLVIYLDKVPKKYQGLSPVELAISESQERMSCVIEKENWESFKQKALEENLEATVIAEVTDDDFVTMKYHDETVVSLSRAFVDSAGAKKTARIKVDEFASFEEKGYGDTFEAVSEALLQDLNIASKRGLIENFDGSIGAGSVLMPLGGKTQLTPSQVMAAKIPLEDRETNATSLFTYGFDVDLSFNNPYIGGYTAVLESMTRLMASGLERKQVYLSLQEYFPSLKQDPKGWGKPFAALLGAFQAQLDFKVPAIGGKDSMSGTFENIDVPPTLISFATAVSEAKNVLSSEFKKADSKLYLFVLPMLDKLRIDTESLPKAWDALSQAMQSNKILSSWAVSRGGILEGLYKMAFGNEIGFSILPEFSLEELTKKNYGKIIVEATEDLGAYFVPLGFTTLAKEASFNGEVLDLKALAKKWEAPFESLYPTKPQNNTDKTCQALSYTKRPELIFKDKVTKPLAVIPVFPGTNCEFDTKKQVLLAGGEVETVLIANLTPELLNDSVARLENALNRANMLILPGGFSFGDEPDGSGKFIAAFLKHDRLKRAIEDLLYRRDGLALGICNGFQALVKLGLLPYGEIKALDDKSPTLTFNEIARHQSRYVKTRIASVHSPWLSEVNVGDIHEIPISHGEGRFVCNDDLLNDLIQNGQIATQYVNENLEPSLSIDANPNGSCLAIEGLISKDGRILGKMGHSERVGQYIAKNISGNKDQGLFRSGVSYFTGKKLN